MTRTCPERQAGAPRRRPGLAVLTLAALGLGLAAGCHAPRAARSPEVPAPAKAPAKDAPRRTDTRLDAAMLDRLTEAHAAFGAGIVRQLQEDPSGQLEYWTRAHEADPRNEALAVEVARRRLARKEFPAALAVLQRAAARPDATPEVHSLLGLTHLQMGRGPEALQAYRVALSKQPRNPAAYIAFARLLLDQGHAEEALRTLDQGVAHSQEDPTLLVQFAETLQLVRTKEPRRVAATQARMTAWLDRAGSLDPKDPSTLLRLAELNKTLGRAESAERLFKASKARAPRNPLASARLAEMYLKEGKLAEATEQLESLQRDDPTNPAPWYYLGLLAMERRDFPRAEELLSRSLALDPDQEPARVDLAATQLSQDRPGEALETLAKARAKSPPSFRAEFLAALAHARRKDHVAARESLLVAERIATTNNPALLNAGFHFQLGLTCSEIPGRRAEAEDRLQRALKLKPDLDEAQNALGYLWAEQGVRLEEAQRLIESALKAEPDNPAYLDSLGWVLFRRGRPADAVKPLSRAVEQMRKAPDATLLDHLADVLAALGKWAEARAAWEEALTLGPNPAIQKKLDEAGKR